MTPAMVDTSLPGLPSSGVADSQIPMHGVSPVNEPIAIIGMGME